MNAYKLAAEYRCSAKLVQERRKYLERRIQKVREGERCVLQERIQLLKQEYLELTETAHYLENYSRERSVRCK